jgi:hypothetical protein
MVLHCLLPPSALPGISPTRGEIEPTAKAETQSPSLWGRCHEVTEGGKPPRMKENTHADR